MVYYDKWNRARATVWPLTSTRGWGVLDIIHYRLCTLGPTELNFSWIFWKSRRFSIKRRDYKNQLERGVAGTLKNVVFVHENLQTWNRVRIFSIRRLGGRFIKKHLQMRIVRALKIIYCQFCLWNPADLKFSLIINLAPWMLAYKEGT